MTNIKYDFFDQSFDVSTANTKVQGTNKYVELNYPGDNKKPVLSYDGMQFYPVRLVISSLSGNNLIDYVMVLETVSKVNGVLGHKLFIKMNIKHESTATNGSLTTLFSAIGTNTTALKPATVNLNSLLGDPIVYPAKHTIYKNTSADLTLYIAPAITVKLDDRVKPILTGNVILVDIFKTITADDAMKKVKQITLVASPLTQRQRCTRSTDNASKPVAVVKPPNMPNVQTNILVFIIIGLCVAAFFPTIYSMFVCLPAGKAQNHGAIHMIYFTFATLISAVLTADGFYNGNTDSQVLGVGMIIIMLISFWQYSHLSSNMLLKCGTEHVTRMSFMSQFGQLWFESPKVSIPLFIAIGLGLYPSIGTTKDGDKQITIFLITYGSIMLFSLFMFRLIYGSDVVYHMD
jgi:hypothetical protein